MDHRLHGTVVGVGASAGGLEAFSAVLEALPADTGMSIVFISHLDPKHESILTSLLARVTPMPVLEAKHGMLLQPDHVYVIPRNASMTIDQGALSLSLRLQAPAENLPIDHFMKSLARDRRDRAIGVILSGTASDGTIGLAAIKREGGITFAQDPGTATYDGMPKSAITSMVADFVLPPKEIAAMLVRIARSPGTALGAAAPPRAPDPSEGGLAGVLAALRERTGSDFSAYKDATVQRRVGRRMAHRRIRSFIEYAHLLRRDPAEAGALYEDLLIKVTEFFRDARTFEKLKTTILPARLKLMQPKEPFRVWVPGCSTGQEAYSIAILLFEVMSRLRLHNPIQIFGTDLSKQAIAAARNGDYATDIADSMSTVRLRQFFEKSGRGYKISKRVRDACVFARHDLTRDPPFSRLDLVSCRNVLIYMGAGLQDAILPIFHYALKPGGYLLLGKAESLGSFPDLFVPVDWKRRIYRKKSVPDNQAVELPARLPRRAPDFSTGPSPREQPGVRTDVGVREEAKRLIMERYAPAGVVINEEMEILEILGDIHPFVRLTPGSANLSLLRLVRRDLAAQLSAAVDLARRSGAPVRKQGRPIKSGHEGTRGPCLEILPMAAGSGQGRRHLVLFETDVPPSAGEDDKVGAAGTKVRKGIGGNGRDLLLLRQELAESQERLRLLMDGRQTTEEELKSANEELMSSMEELQSANEELQTSHEELESTNEELTTVNDQLEVRNRDLSEISNDLANLVTSVNVPTLMLTDGLRLRRSTVAADNVLGLTPADIGRHISEIRHTLKLSNLADLAAEVLKTLAAKEIEVQDRSNVWYSMRLRPYRTHDNRIDGVVVVLLEVNRLKRSLQEVERSRNFSKTIVEAVHEPLLILDGTRRVIMANDSFLKTFHLTSAAIENRLVYELKPGGFHSASFKSQLEETIAGRSEVDFEVEFEIGGPRSTIMAIDARQFDLHEDGEKIVLLTMTDITRFRLAERRLVAARDLVQKGRLRAESSLRETKQDLRSSRSELRILAGRLIRSQEEERKRVARELHDDLSQRLSALQLGSADLARQTSGMEPARAGHQVHQERLAEIVGEVRRMAYDLHPAILTHLGLRAALKSYCVEFSKREGIDVEFSAQKEPATLTEEISLCLYRVTQESLRNVARHSGAESVSISLRKADGVLHLSIRDSGKGFLVRPDWRGEGLGLLSMNERVRLVHGTFQVRSRVGHGTRIEVRVPIPSKSRRARSAVERT